MLFLLVLLCFLISTLCWRRVPVHWDILHGVIRRVRPCHAMRGGAPVMQRRQRRAVSPCLQFSPNHVSRQNAHISFLGGAWCQLPSLHVNNASLGCRLIIASDPTCVTLPRRLLFSLPKNPNSSTVLLCMCEPPHEPAKAGFQNYIERSSSQKLHSVSRLRASESASEAGPADYLVA